MKFAILYIVTAVLTCQADETQIDYNKDITFLIEHALGGKFVPRSTVNLLRKSDGRQGLTFLEKNGIYGDHLAQFKELLENDDLYTIRIQTINNSSYARPIITSLPACELQKSGFKEDLLIHLDAHQNILGVSYSSPVIAVSRECDSNKVKNDVNLQTRMKIADRVIAQSIPLQAVGPRPSHIQDAKPLQGEDGIQKPPSSQSFLSKYWYIVVLMLVYVFLGGVKEEQRKTAGSGEPPTAANK